MSNYEMLNTKRKIFCPSRPKYLLQSSRAVTPTKVPNFIVCHNFDHQEKNSEFLESKEYLETVIEVMDIPCCDIRSKKSKQLYKTIENSVKNFDRQYDNTVLDSYAFDKVLKSDELNNAIYYYLYESNYCLDKDLECIKETIYAYVLHKVKQVYKRNNHKLVNPNIYYNYIDKLFNRILAN